MQKENVPLQIDLFTGVAVDARTRTQKQIDQEQSKPRQIEMFRQRDVAQFGVRANPLLPLSEHTKLVLIREDPRTPEEIKRDRELKAQSLTNPLFETTNQPEPVVTNPKIAVDLIFSPPGLNDIEQADENTDEENDLPELPPPLPSKLSIYLQLIELSHEREATLYASKPMLLSQRIAMGVLRVEAKRVGLVSEEIQAATLIGEYRAKILQKVNLPSLEKKSVPAPTNFPETSILLKRKQEAWLEMSRI